MKLLSLSPKPTILYSAKHLFSLPSGGGLLKGSHPNKRWKKRHLPSYFVLFLLWMKLSNTYLLRLQHLIPVCSFATTFSNSLAHTFRDTSHV